MFVSVPLFSKISIKISVHITNCRILKSAYLLDGYSFEKKDKNSMYTYEDVCIKILFYYRLLKLLCKSIVNSTFFILFNEIIMYTEADVYLPMNRKFLQNSSVIRSFLSTHDEYKTIFSCIRTSLQPKGSSGFLY